MNNEMNLMILRAIAYFGMFFGGLAVAMTGVSQRTCRPRVGMILMVAGCAFALTASALLLYWAMAVVH